MFVRWFVGCICVVIGNVFVCMGAFGEDRGMLRVCCGREGVSLRGRVWEGVCLCRKGVCVLTGCCVGGTAL